MADPYGRRGRTTYEGPNSWRKRTTTRSGSELQPPDPYRCWHHARPDKFTCPECIEIGEQWWEARVDV